MTDSESFLKYLTSEKRLSSHTILAYENDLSQFGTFLDSQFEEKEITAASYGMVRSWVASLVESGLQPRSVNRKIAALRSFYKYLRKQSIISADPMTRIRVLKTSKKLPAFLKESEVVSMLDGEVFENTFEGKREQLMLEIFYATGMRLSELLTLRDININLSARTIKVLGKRNKERVIPFPESLIALIKSYRKVRNQQVSMKDHGLLFVTENGDPCYPKLVYRIVKKHLTQHTNSEKKSPHVLRHTYATHLLDKGAQINAVKELLGHASLAATQVYTHNTMEKLKKVFDQAHPKA